MLSDYAGDETKSKRLAEIRHTQIAQYQIFIVVHAPGVLAIIGDEALQLLAQLRRLGPHALETRDDFLHLAGA